MHYKQDAKLIANGDAKIKKGNRWIDDGRDLVDDGQRMHNEGQSLQATARQTYCATEASTDPECVTWFCNPRQMAQAK